MANHYQCKKCNSKNVELKQATRFEAQSTVYYNKEGKLNPEDKSFGTSQEPGRSFFYCKDCHNLDEDLFTILPDID